MYFTLTLVNQSASSSDSLNFFPSAAYFVFNSRPCVAHFLFEVILMITIKIAYEIVCLHNRVNDSQKCIVMNGVDVGRLDVDHLFIIYLESQNLKIKC